jgi:hypothetical protein
LRLQQEQQTLSILTTQAPPPTLPPISPPPASFHTEGDGGHDLADDFSTEEQGSQFGMTSIRPRSTTAPLPRSPPQPLMPMVSRKMKTKSRFFQLVRDDSLVMGQRIRGGPVAEVWITEEFEEEDEVADHYRQGGGLSGAGISESHQHHNGYPSTPTYQSVLESSSTSSPSGAPAVGPGPYYPLVRSDRSSSVTSNNGNTFMTDVSAATGGPVRSSTMTGPLIRPVPSGRSYASSRYPLSDMDTTPAPSFQEAMTSGGGGAGTSSGYYGPSHHQQQHHHQGGQYGGGTTTGAGHAQTHRRQRSSVAFSSSRSSSIAPTEEDDNDHEDLQHHHHHHHHHHHRHQQQHYQQQQRDGPSSQTPTTLRSGPPLEGDNDDAFSSFPKGLRQRKCTIRVMNSLNQEASTFALSTGPRLPELFDLFTDQSVPGPSRGAFICSVITFALVFLVIFISLAFTHKRDDV